jgi:hypothetical protein
MKGGEFLDQLSDYRLLKESAPWGYLIEDSLLSVKRVN